MVGRAGSSAHTGSTTPAENDVVLEVRHPDASFSVRRGEILVFCGLAGAGRSELAQAIFGARAFRR